MGHDHIGFKAWKVKFIETLKWWEAMQGNKHDIDAVLGHLQVTQQN